MKRDEVREGLGHLVDYTRSHGRQVVLAIAAVALAAAAVGGWMFWRSHRSEQANELLARAIQLHRAPIDAVAPRPDDPRQPSFADESERAAASSAVFEEVRERFGGTRVGAVAAAYLADLAARRGDLAAARPLWQEAGKRGAGALADVMLLNRLAADRAEGRGEEALAELRGMLDDESAPLSQEVVLDQMALTLETLGREEEAAEVYRRIVEEHPQSALAVRAQQRAPAS